MLRKLLLTAAVGAALLGASEFTPAEAGFGIRIGIGIGPVYSPAVVYAPPVVVAPVAAIPVSNYQVVYRTGPTAPWITVGFGDPVLAQQRLAFYRHRGYEVIYRHR
jgi:hypothetical protein